MASDDTVEYQNRIYKLSPFVGTFLPVEKQTPSGAYQGAKYFSYKGKVLDELGKEKELESLRLFPFSFILRQSQAQRIKHYAYAGEGHQGTCPHWGYLEINSEDMKGAGCQRDADDVVDERPEEILPNHVNRLLTQFYGFRKCQEVVAHQRNLCHIHRHIRSLSYRHAHVGKG